MYTHSLSAFKVHLETEIKIERIKQIEKERRKKIFARACFVKREKKVGKNERGEREKEKERERKNRKKKRDIYYGMDGQASSERIPRKVASNFLVTTVFRFKYFYISLKVL